MDAATQFVPWYAHLGKGCAPATCPPGTPTSSPARRSRRIRCRAGATCPRCCCSPRCRSGSPPPPTSWCPRSSRESGRLLAYALPLPVVGAVVARRGGRDRRRRRRQQPVLLRLHGGRGLAAVGAAGSPGRRGHALAAHQVAGVGARALAVSQISRLAGAGLAVRADRRRGLDRVAHARRPRRRPPGRALRGCAASRGTGSRCSAWAPRAAARCCRGWSSTPCRRSRGLPARARARRRLDPGGLVAAAATGALARRHRGAGASPRLHPCSPGRRGAARFWPSPPSSPGRDDGADPAAPLAGGPARRGRVVAHAPERVLVVLLLAVALLAGTTVAAIAARSCRGAWLAVSVAVVVAGQLVAADSTRCTGSRSRRWGRRLCAPIRAGPFAPGPIPAGRVPALRPSCGAPPHGAAGGRYVGYGPQVAGGRVTTNAYSVRWADPRVAALGGSTRPCRGGWPHPGCPDADRPLMTKLVAALNGGPQNWASLR